MSLSTCTAVVCFIVLVAPTITCKSKHESSKVADTELVMAFMIHRHGDRTPVTSTIDYVTDKEAVLNLVAKIGFGQLTNPGRKTSFATGTFIRERYDSLLSSQYNMSEIFIRSTVSTRARMTVLTAMAAVYPAVKPWCENEECGVGKWTPVPYYMVPAVFDYNLPFLNCPVYKKQMNNSMTGPVPAMSKYFGFLDEWSKIIDYNITQRPTMAYLIYDAYISQINLGVPISPELKEILPSIEEAAAAAIYAILANDEYLSLGTGVLLNEFFKTVKKVISKENVPKVYVYSAHDFNVYSFIAGTRARPLGGPPKFGSLYSLELRKVVTTGKFVVVPIYLKSPNDGDVLELKIEGCGDLCELSKFQKLVYKYNLDFKKWKKQCKWSADQEIDESEI